MELVNLELVNMKPNTYLVKKWVIENDRKNYFFFLKKNKTKGKLKEYVQNRYHSMNGKVIAKGCYENNKKDCKSKHKIDT